MPSLSLSGNAVTENWARAPGAGFASLNTTNRHVRARKLVMGPKLKKFVVSLVMLVARPLEISRHSKRKGVGLPLMTALVEKLPLETTVWLAGTCRKTGGIKTVNRAGLLMALLIGSVATTS